MGNIKIHTRFGDKVTFIALVIGVAVSFCACLGIYAYEFYQTQEFWEASVSCIAHQDFECLLEVRGDQAINKDLLLSMIGVSLCFQGMIFGFLSVTLYKAMIVEPKNNKEEKKK